MTHIQARRNAATACMLEMLDILQWTWMQYCYFKYECGQEYIRLLCDGDVFVISQIEKSALFWGWWKNHWTLREETLLLEFDAGNRVYHVETIRLMFIALHDPGQLLHGVCKFRYDMDNDYARIINRIQHE